MFEAIIAIIAGLIFICFFPLLWFGIVYLISRIGGWSVVARHYAFQGAFSGTMFQMQSARTGPMGSYRNCMTFGANDDGLYLSPLVFFRPGHPPLMIPWGDIETRETRTLFSEMVALSPRLAPARTISISKPLAKKLSRASGVRWRFESMKNDENQRSRN